MPYPNEHSCRLKPPNYKRYARKNCYKKHEGKCIDYVFGIISKDKSELQSLRYKKDIWSKEAARKHCKDEGGTFEPAEEEKKSWYEMTVNKKDEAAEISIFNEIGGIFGISVDQFKKDFDAIKNNKKIKLLLNSPGGSVFDGMAIYNILAAYKSKINVEVMGIAASIASVIALSGEELTMGEGSYLMIHDPMGLCVGTAEDMRKVAEVLEKIAGQIANIYTNNSNLDKDEVLQKMKDETWFTADEAVEAGFADNIVNHGKPKAIAFDIDKYGYAHVPEEIQKRAEQFRAQQAAFEEAKIETDTVETAKIAAHGLTATMIGTENDSVSEGGEFEEVGGEELKTLTVILAALYALSDEERAKATEEDKKQVAEIFGFDELEKKNTELAESMKDLQQKDGLKDDKIVLLLNEKQELAKELTDLKAKNAQTEKHQIIEKALSEGKITPKNRSRWEETFDKDPEGTKKLLAEQEPVVDFNVYGTGAGGDEASLSQEEKEKFEKAGLSEEEVKKYGPKAGKEK